MNISITEKERSILEQVLFDHLMRYGIKSPQENLQQDLNIYNKVAVKPLTIEQVRELL